MIAASALLLASSLEVCGCDVALDCAQIRALQISAESWPTLLRRCVSCLSSEEVAKVIEQRNRIAAPLFGAVPEMSETVGEALGERAPLSFYEPGIAPREAVISPQTPSRPSSPSFSARSRPLTWPIPESVFFVYPEAGIDQNSARSTPIATAFVISVPDLNHRDRTRFLVTARHVVDPQWAHCPVRNPGFMVVRLNRWTAAPAYVRIRLEIDHARQYVTPTDTSADIAVIRLDDRVLPDLESYKLMETPYSLLPTDEELEAISKNAGTRPSWNERPVVTAGLKSQPFSADRSVAVIHSGTLTGVPADPVDIRCGPGVTPTPLHVWTIDAAVAPEASGAPVYTTITRSGSVTETPVLLGVQSVVWPGERAAGITPSSALSEVIQLALGRNGQHMDLYKGAAP